MQDLPEEWSSIARSLGFTLDELALNRAGQISSHQAWENVRMALFPVGLALVFLGMLLVFVFLVKPAGVGRLLYAVPIVGLVVMVGLAWYFAVAAWQHRVLVAQGPLHFQKGRGGPSIVVDRIWVQDSPHAAPSTLMEGNAYRLYYVARSRRFLSIEPLAERP